MRGARVSTLVAFCALAAVLLSGCSSGESPDPSPTAGISVTGELGTLPEVTFTAPLEMSSSSSKKVTDGSGGAVRNGEPVVINLSIYNGRTGELARSTYQEGQHPLATYPTSESLFPVVQNALQGTRAGDRIQLAVPSKDAFGAAGAPQYGIEPTDSVVMIIDIMGTPPETNLTVVTGEPKSPPRGMPKVIYQEGIPSRVEFPGRIPRLKAPRIVSLIDGDGPTIRVGNILSLNHIKQKAGSDSSVWNSWTRSPETFIFDNEGGLQSWQQALIGVQQGSRVMILVPDEDAKPGKSKPLGWVYVVDVLGVG